MARPQPGSHPTHPSAMGPQKPALRVPLLLLFLLLFLDTSVWARELGWKSGRKPAWGQSAGLCYRPPVTSGVETGGRLAIR